MFKTGKLKFMIILAIETSCDETALSIVKAEGDLESLSFKVLASALRSQIEMHREYGGVVPMLAKREHLKNLPILYDLVTKEAGDPKIDLIVVTQGPGLEPALWTGIKFAENLSQKLGVPILGANHMEGHIASVLLNKEESSKEVTFPALALLISGGHTELILMKNWAEKEKIGETKDDAVGEAYDKVARMLGLDYPGGPEIARLAKQARDGDIKNERLRLPRPMIHSKDFNFSFSGLKTAVLYYLRTLKGIEERDKLEVAREFEEAVSETIIHKTISAIKEYGPKTLVVGGGVVSNDYLRTKILDLKESFSELEILIPEPGLTTDNATMIALAGYIQYLNQGLSDQKLEAIGNLPI